MVFRRVNFLHRLSRRHVLCLDICDICYHVYALQCGDLVERRIVVLHFVRGWNILQCG